MEDDTMKGTEHWTTQGRHPAFPLAQAARRRRAAQGTILFVHGSSMASQPTFDLQVPGRAGFLGDGLVRRARLRHLVHGQRGLRPLGQVAADQLATSRTAPTTSPRAPTTFSRTTGAKKLLVYGISSGALQRGAVRRSAIPSASRASRWTPSSGPARAARRSPSAGRSCPSSSPRTAARSTAPSCTASSSATIPAPPTRPPSSAFADAIVALDDSVPTGTYVDMCSKLPIVDPAKITVPTHHHARPVGRHRGRRRPDRVLQAPAATRTSSSRVMAGHLARELPAEELPDGLPHPARLLHAARTGVPRMNTVRFSSYQFCLVNCFIGNRATVPAPPGPSGRCRFRRAASPTRRRALLRRSLTRAARHSMVFVENQPGAGRHDRLRTARRSSAPDGYTLLLTGTHARSSARISTRTPPVRRAAGLHAHRSMLASGPYVPRGRIRRQSAR